MAILPVIRCPHPILRSPYKPVIEINQGILKIVNDMIETIYASPGCVGVAAPQTCGSNKPRYCLYRGRKGLKGGMSEYSGFSGKCNKGEKDHCKRTQFGRTGGRNPLQWA